MKQGIVIGLLAGSYWPVWAGTVADPAVAGDPATPGPAAMTDIHDIKPILFMGMELQWLYWTLGLLVLAGLAFLLWRRWKERSKQAPSLPPVPEMPAHEQAYRALDALAAEQGLAPRRFYFRISAILRHYIERQYQFPAAEMTTEELLPRMDGLALERSVVDQFKALCRAADPVKFAGADAGPEQLKGDLAFARRFVQHSMSAIQETEKAASDRVPNHSTPSALPGPGDGGRL